MKNLWSGSVASIELSNMSIKRQFNSLFLND
jgi:hypothetical protein